MYSVAQTSCRASLRATHAVSVARPSARRMTSSFRVYSASPEENAEIAEPAAVESTPVTEQVSTPPSPTPIPETKTPGFGDVMAFSGAPEIINGRLAMLAFISALGAEISSGESVFAQFKDAPVGIIGTFLLFTAASLIPIFKNSKPEAFGPLTPHAEMTNGRAAMLGFASLLLVEVFRGSALF